MALKHVLVAALCVAASDAGGLQRPSKRRNTWYEPVLKGAAAVLARAAEVLHLTTPSYVYDMHSEEEKLNLIDALWGTAWVESVGSRFSEANPALRYLLEEQRVDDAEAAPRFRAVQGLSRWEAAIAAIFRARSSKIVTIETAAVSVMWQYYRVPKPVWDAMGYFSDVVMSRTFTGSLCDMAVERDPGPAYAVASGITAAVFDNFQMQANYKGYAVGGIVGEEIKMTNWASVFLPATVMPAGFTGFAALLSAGGIFRTDICMEDFLDGFSLYSPDIIRNQKVRWAKFLDLASVGSLWDGEHFDSPYPPTKFYFHTPIWDRLQSSYDDVNFEVDTMRGHVFHKLSDALMIGGDGLSYMRLIHRLAQHPRRYLETMPVVMPRLGENPHGLYHFMHGDWRIWAPLLMRLAKIVSNRQVKPDPNIVDFNTHQHFLRVVTQALAQYVIEIARTGTDYHACQQFLDDAERNLSFAYIVFFLHMFGFKYLQYRMAVRRNESKTLDMLWRENLASARTAKANKVNYRQMSVILVYWGTVLVEPLQTFYHNSRTIRWIWSHVGWDMPIEKLNGWIRESVISNISKWRISQFIRRLNFMQHVIRGVKKLAWAARVRDEATVKDIDVDVQIILVFLREVIGTTYAAATRPSDENLMDVDMADWGGLRRPRARAPFNQVRNGNAGYRWYVRRQLTKLCPWHHWQ